MPDYSEGMVPVARFQCLGTPGSLPTFSLLPWQLAPYHRYTIVSMAWAVLLFREVFADGDGGPGVAIEMLHNALE